MHNSKADRREIIMLIATVPERVERSPHNMCQGRRSRCEQWHTGFSQIGIEAQSDGSSVTWDYLTERNPKWTDP